MNSINLFGRNFEIKYTQEKVITNDYKGRILFDEQEIIINERLKPETQNLTLLHEIIHEIIDHSGIEKILKDKKISSEHIVELFSSHLFNVMVSNKEFFYKFLEKEYDLNA